MPGPLRLIIYLATLGVGLIAGRYLVPAKQNLLTGETTASAHDAGRLEFWGQTTRAILDEADPAKRTQAFLTLLSKLQPAEFSPVAEATRSNPLASQLLTIRWAETDPSGCFKYLASHGLKSPLDHEMAALLLYTWAGKDLNSATAAASRLRVPGAVPDSQAAICYSLLQTDARQGLQYTYQNRPELATTALLPLLQVENEQSPRWKSLDLSGRIDFFQSQPASELREAALDKLFALWSNQDPKSLLLAAQDSGRGTDLIPKALQLWMEKDANGVSQFFQNDAKDAVKAAAGLALAKRVAAADPQAAWDFAQWFLSGAPRSNALRNVLAAIAKGDPHDAALRLADLPDAPWRRQALADLAVTWHAKDAESALSWIESELSGVDQKATATALAHTPALPEEVRGQIRSRFKLPDP